MRGRINTSALVVAAFLLPVAPATADPGPPPTEPAPAPPVPVEFIPQQTGIGNPLAQSGSQTGPLGLPDLSAYGPTMLLGQNPTPAAPGDPATAAVPSLSAFNPQYLLEQNTAPAAPGDGAPAPGLGPNQDIPGTGRISFLHRLYEMYQTGALKGSLLGQQSPEEFAQQAAETTTVFTTPPVPPPPA